MKKFFWIDLEMTGLDDLRDSILEVAVVITDLNLQTLETFHRVVFQPAEVISQMNDWCKKTHGESGLTALIPGGVPLSQVEQELLKLADKHFSHSDRIVLCGNSVSNDRRFIDRYLKNFEKRLHYRLIDVSSFKEIFREKWGLQYEKKNAHRAIDDIYESIKELQYYLSYFKMPEELEKPL